MRLGAIRDTVFEAQALVGKLAEEAPRPGGGLHVSGMLAEQLARQLGAGAAPGAVNFGEGALRGATSIRIHVIAGDPTEADAALVRDADAVDVPVVLVQLWPQADWTPPFVLTPFVVECRAGEGFPIAEIVARVAEAAEDPDALSLRVPLLRDRVASNAVRESAVRAGLLGLFGTGGATRPLVTLEQARMTARLSPASPGTSGGAVSPAMAGTAGALFASGIVFRSAARSLRGGLPTPLANAAVAAFGTWALGEVVRRLEARNTRT